MSLTCDIVWADEAFAAAQSYLGDDPEGLAAVFDVVDELAENPRPTTAFAWGRADLFRLRVARSVLKAAATSDLHAYISMSLLTGARTEELRALTWANLDLDGDPAATPPRPPNVQLWRSVRATGDTKTKLSRRTLALPLQCVRALAEHRTSQDVVITRMGDQWQHHDLVFCTQRGTPLDAANVRRSFRRVLRAAGLDAESWTPRELRHSFVSLMSDAGVPVEESPGSWATAAPWSPRRSTVSSCAP